MWKKRWSWCLRSCEQIYELDPEQNERYVIRQFMNNTSKYKVVDPAVCLSSHRWFVMIFPAGSSGSSAQHIFNFLCLFCPLKVELVSKELNHFGVIAGYSGRLGVIVVDLCYFALFSL